MVTPRPTVVAFPEADKWAMTRIATVPRFRILAWSGDLLYASHAYTLLRAKITITRIEWEIVGYFRPTWWRNLTVTLRLTSRFFRDGFHALAVLPTGHFVATVPGAIISLAPGEIEFRISHEVVRGTRPLHITATPDKRLFWGEYFDNPQRDEVHIYASEDRGMSWDVAYTFPKGAIRYVHNMVYDEWDNCLWILTGDNGAECRILRASCDLKEVDVVLSGNQQARAVAAVPMKDGLYFSSDTPVETNHVYRLDRRGNLTKLADLSSSSIYGCRVGDSIFFSTMAEPSAINSETSVCLFGSRDGQQWRRVLEWKKDSWPMDLFQYGNVFLPDGSNTSGYLALTSVAVENGDLETTVWRI
ncbi:MAG: hypothetical protein DMG70_32470 [Acidobacteria bacterium]|nr:MAG: hypothetical protein DMG70_32470 [Acidobacteriota bacterium]